MTQVAQTLKQTRVLIAASELAAPVVTYLVTENCWLLEETYKHQDGDHLVTIPQGFKFDLASIPRFFWWLIAPFELSIAAPLLHDFLYRYRGDPPQGSITPHRIYTRKQADVLFKRIMKQEGVWQWRRQLAYIAVRWFGKKAWQD